MEETGALGDGVEVYQKEQFFSADYEPDFAPEGKMILQSNFTQSETDYEYWETLRRDENAYRQKKKKVAQTAMQRLLTEYPLCFLHHGAD